MFSIVLLALRCTLDQKIVVLFSLLLCELSLLQETFPSQSAKQDAQPPPHLWHICKIGLNRIVLFCGKCNLNKNRFSEWLLNLNCVLGWR